MSLNVVFALPNLSSLLCFFRVPILGMPIFGDQPDNAARLKERGLGEKKILKLFYISKKDHF